ncbi:putative adenylyltransferase/sulfurtransferase MoeZ [Clostridium pasteurianum DSM 525 = ATCC 6013]|uniref:Putative adenylyltransferase/sulfurtransferase MoeZ n=1 Tax=Clostridium pasteurianum DSM 525 = ATCC 6013 TaxID=1262449 RepID=A0A0H3IYG4_CLOPA|nr:HesA/MoeB/ThiF family protein [Clostridium pasteurianum]AJA46551.1 putative adenylyltransferase/sulfurtransferase MoeZ [Clostridium pasteurianum DSM 525 = ATCC 6013]AJA50539.1 putative adenylyltransferase/sulfurtransferase MoeZ [Clostridium pasteurianum DSM 525 = ATCC 6013]AOZ73975.1 adenylyltransferase [Clostridium pasteurianum DSM 525 = ATCC 6013]AOZ77772.1 adenylyltransferase [Clostridium pasteurianum]ELP61123.1 hypothetical protein F502_01670 [Clostridium pasteurianum DSM 525 = ATCC 601
MEFSEEQIQRYSRNIILSQVGAEGQEKLLNSKVLIMGAGGLGSPVAMYLASAGVGTIGLVDGDVVDLSNLQRQIIHSAEDVGRAKVQSAKESINKVNPDINVITYNTILSSENIMQIIEDQDYDFIIDATDNFPTKFLINDACVLAKKPLCSAGVIEFHGQLTTYIPDNDTPCFRCIFQSPPPAGTIPTCCEAGVLGAVVGVIGNLQALEALKYLLEIEENLAGYLLTFDGITMEFRKIQIGKNSKCGVCGDKPEIKDLIDYERSYCNL